MPEKTSQTAVLIGATGLVGRALIPILAANFSQTYAITRKPVTGLPSKVSALVLDFDTQWQLPRCDTAFCALGTTIKVAGSEAKFHQVDFDYVLKAATAAKAAGAHQFGVVSAMGASTKSAVFYNRTKGEMEEALQALNFAQLLIVRPSFLAGDRESLGQVARPAERFALMLAKPLAPLIPKKYRSVPATAVASCLVESLKTQSASVTIIESDAIQSWVK
jgi:uncharacterized protein YbjT (DUF2867 family)